MEMVQFKDYSFSYPSKKILNNINLEINQGDFVLICGPSGCGKTTLLMNLKMKSDLKEMRKGRYYTTVKTSEHWIR